MEADFKKALSSYELHTDDKIIADGKLHRFCVRGDSKGSKNGWYVVFCDGVPAGCFGSWKTGQKYTWYAKSNYDLTPAQREDNKRRMIKARKAREVEERQRRNAARSKALSIWKASMPAPDTHLYLVKKGIRNHGLRLYKTSLVIPMRDSAGNLHSLQFIDGAGNKRFLFGGRKKGCYFALGIPSDAICIAEGYATAASIHEVTGLACAVAFDARNLEFVAKSLRDKFPYNKIILCADNDANNPVNVGVEKARHAARVSNGLLAIPPCAGDFNDWYNGGIHE